MGGGEGRTAQEWDHRGGCSPDSASAGCASCFLVLCWLGGGRGGEGACFLSLELSPEALGRHRGLGFSFQSKPGPHSLRAKVLRTQTLGPAAWG